MFFRFFLALAFAVQTSIPAYALSDGGSQFYYRYSKTGIINKNGSEEPGEQGKSLDISDQAKTILGKAGSPVSWSPSAGAGASSPVLDRETGKSWPGAITFSSNVDLSQYGLAFDPATGHISGTPSKGFIIRDFRLTATSQGKSDTTAPFWIGAAPAVSLTVASTQKRSYTVSTGSSFSTDAISVENTVGDVTFSKPAGVFGASWNESSGVLSTTPAVSGTQSYTTSVSDEFGRAIAFTFDVTAQSGLTMAELAALTIEGERTYDGSTTVRLPWVTGNSGQLNWNVTGLPSGLDYNLVSGAISGSVSDGALQGSHDVSVEATDTSNNQKVSKSFTVAVEPPFISTGFSGASLIEFKTVTNVGFILRYKGNNEGYFNRGLIWTKVSGTLPAGLTTTSVDDYLAFTGRATETGSFTSTWHVQDNKGWSQTFDPITLTVAERPEIIVTVPTTTVNGTVVYTTAAPAVAPTVTNILATAFWSAEGLPEGLAISPTTGVITGNVINGAMQGVHHVKLTVIDSADGADASAEFDLTVASPMTHPKYVGAQLRLNVPTPGNGLIVRDLANVAYRGHDLVWEMVSGALPPGVTTTANLEHLNFTGTPTQIGDYVSTWKVTDRDGWTMTFNPITLSVVTRDPLTVAAIADRSINGDATFTTASPVAAAVAQSAIGTVTWSSENLPAGLVIGATSGIISGSVTNGSFQGTREVTVTATDSADKSSQSTSFYLTVNAPFTAITYTPTDLQQGVDMLVGLFNLRDSANVAYRNKGTTAELISGTLPPGVDVFTSGEFVVFSGKPTTLGSYKPVVKVVDQHGWTLTLPAVTLTVKVKDPITLNAMSNVSTPGNKTFTESSPLARGTASNFSGSAIWSAVGLPSGLSIDQSTGAIIGSVTDGNMQGDHFVTVTVADSGDGSSKSTSFMLTVTNAFTSLSYTPPVLRATTAMMAGGFALRDANTGLAYTGKGAVGTQLSGSLPAGINAIVVGDTLTFSGTPTTPGTYTSTWAITDASGWLLVLPSITFTVAPANPITVAAIATTTVVGNADYTSSPLLVATASNASGSVKWTAQNLPAGLSINQATGAVTGSVTDGTLQGSRTVTITATDDFSSRATSFTMNVNAAFYAASFTTPALTMSVPVNFGIPLRDSLSNVAYANKGVNISLVSGTPVPGVTAAISAGNFVFTGSPTASGTYTSTWKLTDASGWNITVVTTFSVTARTVIVVSQSPMTAVGMTTYTTAAPLGAPTVTAGKIGTISWTAANLPTGLTINSSTGVITGRVTDASFFGTRTVTLTARDSSDSATGVATVSLNVQSPMAARAYTPAVGKVGTAFSGNVVIVDRGNTRYAYSTGATIVSGSLPPGMSAATDGGSNLNFSGTPTASGTYTATTRVTDTSAAGNLGWYIDLTYTFTVNP